jgi:methyltransferase (TIGR00027 family)
MEDLKPSRTAIAVAFIRAHHHLYDEPKIFDDPFAQVLLSASAREWNEANFMESLAELNPNWRESTPNREMALSEFFKSFHAATLTLARARYVEEKILAAVQHGVRQYVNIGAGLDSFAFRHPEFADLQIFEIDLPAMQAFKRQRFAEAGLELPRNLHMAAVNLERETVAEALLRLPFDRIKPAFFEWSGVTYYLSHEAIFSTLRSIRNIAARGSQIVFDYVDAEGLAPENQSPRLQRTLENARQRGEPWISGFDPRMIRNELANVGLDLVEDLGPEEQQARLSAAGFQVPEYWHCIYAIAQ